MKERFALIYRCPQCASPLDIEKDIVVDGEIREGKFWCNCGEQFAIKKGIPRLIAGDYDYTALTSEFEERGEKHVIVEDESYVSKLPLKSSKNKHVWERRRINNELLEKLLKEEGRGRVLDLGVGDCTVASKLAGQQEVFTMDATAGASGLEVADLYIGTNYFERVQGDPTNLPFEDSAFDIAICRISLQSYSPGVIIGEITRVLRDNGVLFIVDAELYHEESSLKGASEEHGFYPILKSELDLELRGAYSTRYFQGDYGRLWGLSRQFASVVRRREYPTYPIIRAKRK